MDKLNRFGPPGPYQRRNQGRNYPTQYDNNSFYPYRPNNAPRPRDRDRYSNGYQHQEFYQPSHSSRQWNQSGTFWENNAPGHNMPHESSSDVQTQLFNNDNIYNNEALTYSAIKVAAQMLNTINLFENNAGTFFNEPNATSMLANTSKYLPAQGVGLPMARNVNQKTMIVDEGRKKLIEGFSQPVESSKAQRMMQKMGWQGGALGAKGKGLTEPIIPNLFQQNRAGLGLSNEMEVFEIHAETNKPKKQVNQQHKDTPKKTSTKKASKETTQPKKQVKLMKKAAPLKDLKECIYKQLLSFVKDNTKTEFVFDNKFSKRERTIIHQVVQSVRENCLIGGNRLKLSEDFEVLQEIRQACKFVLFTQSDGVYPDRRLTLYKEAPENIYMITPSDLRPAEEKQESGDMTYGIEDEDDGENDNDDDENSKDSSSYKNKYNPKDKDNKRTNAGKVISNQGDENSSVESLTTEIIDQDPEKSLEDVKSPPESTIMANSAESSHLNNDVSNFKSNRHSEVDTKDSLQDIEQSQVKTDINLEAGSKISLDSGNPKDTDSQQVISIKPVDSESLQVDVAMRNVDSNINVEMQIVNIQQQPIETDVQRMEKGTDIEHMDTENPHVNTAKKVKLTNNTSEVKLDDVKELSTNKQKILSEWQKRQKSDEILNLETPKDDGDKDITEEIVKDITEEIVKDITEETVKDNELPTKKELNELLLKYFKEYFEDETFKEMRFLGAFDDKEQEAIAEFMNNVKKCIENIDYCDGLESIENFNLRDVFDNDEFELLVHDDCGYPVIRKTRTDLTIPTTFD